MAYTDRFSIKNQALLTYTIDTLPSRLLDLLDAALEASSTYVMKGITNWDSLTTIDSSGGIMVGDPIYWNGSAVVVKPGGNGVAIGANGLFGVQGGVTKFSIDTLGNASFSGAIAGASVTTGGLSVDANLESAIKYIGSGTYSTSTYAEYSSSANTYYMWTVPDSSIYNQGKDSQYYIGSAIDNTASTFGTIGLTAHKVVAVEAITGITISGGTYEYTDGARLYMNQALKQISISTTISGVYGGSIVVSGDNIGINAPGNIQVTGGNFIDNTNSPYATQGWVSSQGYISSNQGYIDWTTNSALYGKTGLIKAVNSVGSVAEYYGIYGKGPTGVIGRCDVAHIARASFGTTGSGTGVYGISTVTYGCGVVGESSGVSGIGGQFLNASSGSFGVVGSGTAYDFYANGSGANYGPFTGSHDVLLAKGTVVVPGDIIVDTNVNYKTNVSQVITIGDVSSLKEDKAVVGVYVIGSSFDENTIVAALTTEDKTTLKSSYDLCSMNSVGEGQINVIGEGGDIAIGDLIVSSSTPGKGMRQSDGIIYNYTVAKAREAVTFGTMSEEKQIACIYLCG